MLLVQIKNFDFCGSSVPGDFDFAEIQEDKLLAHISIRGNHSPKDLRIISGKRDGGFHGAILVEILLRPRESSLGVRVATEVPVL